MSVYDNNTFIQAFGAKVHSLAQQRYSKLRDTVRHTPNSPGLVGTSDRIQRSGKADMVTKGRHAPVPAANVQYDYVDIAVQDYYVREYIDSLDKLKTNVNLQADKVNTLAAAAGRKYDDVIINALSQTTNNITVGGPLTKSVILQVAQQLEENEASEGELIFVISPAVKAQLFSISEYGDQDFVLDRPYVSGMASKTFLGFSWIVSTRLPVSGNVRSCYAYNREFVAKAVAQEPTTEIYYDGDRVATGITTMMSLGAGIVEDAGVIEVDVTE